MRIIEIRPFSKANAGILQGEILVADEDYETFNRFNWFLVRGYAYRNRSVKEPWRSQVSIHREIMGCIPGDGCEVDHIDGDRLNNQRSNLRLVTRLENSQNRAARLGGKSQYRGVSWHAGTQRWTARLMVKGVSHSFGYHKTEEEANAAIVKGRRQLMPLSRN